MTKVTQLLAFVALLLSFTISAQETEGKTEPFIIQEAVDFYVTAPMRSYPQVNLWEVEEKTVPRGGSESRQRKAAAYENMGESPTKLDPLAQEAAPTRIGRQPIINQDGINLNANPPDPSAAVGPNHIVQMTNGLWSVWDKDGNQEPGFPKNLSNPLGGGSGDPIVMYDREADRWFISQFRNPTSSASEFLIAVSTTPDPGGTYNVYAFSPGISNDYPHYSIYGNSYAVAGNFGNQGRVFLFDREKILDGDNTATMVGFTLPGYTRPANPQGNNFSAIMPVHSEGAGIAEGGLPFVYFKDDGWNGVAADEYSLWEIEMDWEDINDTVLTGPVFLPATAFDSHVRGQGAGGAFSNLQQPGTNQRIDAIVGAIMYMAHRYDFGTHESLVFNFMVEVEDNSFISGIRWVELRREVGGDAEDWEVYQEGTFVDPTGDESVFMGCIGMDSEGNMALGYTKTGATTFPSLYYTGRMANDDLGIMTVAETTVVEGTTSVTTNNRYGDYGQLTRDPNDDLTFWYTSEYSGQPRKTRIASFKLSSALSVDELQASDDDFLITTNDNQLFDINLATESTSDILRLSVFNIAGQRVVYNQVSKDNGVYNSQVDMRNMSPGVYIVTIGNSKTKLSKKILVK